MGKLWKQPKCPIAALVIGFPPSPWVLFFFPFSMGEGACVLAHSHSHSRKYEVVQDLRAGAQLQSRARSPGIPRVRAGGRMHIAQPWEWLTSPGTRSISALSLTRCFVFIFERSQKGSSLPPTHPIPHSGSMKPSVLLSSPPLSLLLPPPLLPNLTPVCVFELCIQAAATFQCLKRH